MKLSFLLKPIAAIALFGIVPTFAAAQETAVPATPVQPAKVKRVDPSGTWRFEVDVDGQASIHTLMLMIGKDGEVTGTYKSPTAETVELKAGKVDGDKLTLELEVPYQGSDLPVKLTGTVKGDDITGDILVTTPEGGEIPFDWVAKRGVETEDVVGTWELEIDAVETILEPVLEITLDGKTLKGQYKDADSGLEAVAEEIRIEDNQLKFTIKAEFQGAPLIAKFSGRPYGHKISGAVEYDIAQGQQVGQIDFEGVRKDPKKEEAKPAK